VSKPKQKNAPQKQLYSGVNDPFSQMNINGLGDGFKQSEGSNKFYKNDMMEMPKSMQQTQFQCEILKKIYFALDSNEISIYDSELILLRNKSVNILEVLNGGKNCNEFIDLDELRRASFYGIPVTNKSGQADLRSVVWRVLLGALSL
jgi:hypothetical protein